MYRTTEGQFFPRLFELQLSTHSRSLYQTTEKISWYTHQRGFPRAPLPTQDQLTFLVDHVLPEASEVPSLPQGGFYLKGQ